MSGTYKTPVGRIRHDPSRSAKRTDHLHNARAQGSALDQQPALNSEDHDHLQGSDEQTTGKGKQKASDSGLGRLEHSGNSYIVPTADMTTGARSNSAELPVTAGPSTAGATSTSYYDASSQESSNALAQVLAEAERSNRKRDAGDLDWMPREQKRKRGSYHPTQGSEAPLCEQTIDTNKSPPSTKKRKSHKRKTWVDFTTRTQKERYGLVRVIVQSTGRPAHEIVPLDHRPKGDVLIEWNHLTLQRLKTLAQSTLTDIELAHNALNAAVRERLLGGKGSAEITAADVLTAIENVSKNGIGQQGPMVPPRSPTLALESEPEAARVSVHFVDTGNHDQQGHEVGNISSLPSPKSPGTAGRSRRAEKQPVKVEPMSSSSTLRTTVTEDFDKRIQSLEKAIEEKYKYELEECKNRKKAEKAGARKMLLEQKVRQLEMLNRLGSTVEDPIPADLMDE